MKILFITQRPPYPPNKGDKIRTYNQLLHLTELGHHFTLACPIDCEDDKTNLKAIQKKLDLETMLGSKLNFLSKVIYSFVAKKPYSIYHFFSPILQRKIKFSTSAFDIIICSSSSMIEYMLNCDDLNLSSKLIVDFMDLDSDKWKQYRDNSSGIKKWIYNREYKLLKKYEKLVQKKADYCLFTTDKEVELFKKNIDDGVNTDNLVTIGNGLDNQYFQPVTKQFNKLQPVFIFTGVMDYKPNVDAVTWFSENIWPSILASYPSAKFIVAGMKPNSKVQGLGKLKGVEVTGFVEDIRDYYKQADFFVAPLRIARGVQNKVLEAFACKLPVITTPNAIQGIECVPEEQVLEAETEEQFVEQITRLMESSELRENISTNALELVRTKYSWQGQLQKLDKLIKGDLT